MRVIKTIGTDDLAKVYIAEIPKGRIEFAESVPSPATREEKWVIIVSCLVGCPVGCLMCDAGQQYFGKLMKEEIFEQIDYCVDQRYSDRVIPAEKFKVQFTRMGEPAFNDAVLDVLEELPTRYDARGLLPSVSTVGPSDSSAFFDRLRSIKNQYYSDGKFQMQFSIHTTDGVMRDKLIPTEKMSFEEISEFGSSFFADGDRKITLNFIVMKEYPIESAVLEKFFDPSRFMVKLTPLNPTGNAERNDLTTMLDPDDANSVHPLVSDMQKRGFDVVVSIGDVEENRIGSNCGMFVSAEDEKR